MSFRSLKDTLDQSFKRSPIRGAVLAVQVENATKEVLPPFAKMVSYKKGLLTLTTPSPQHAQELYLKHQDLIKKINSKLKGKAVEEIKFRARG